jgi:hypothetical protein
MGYPRRLSQANPVNENWMSSEEDFEGGSPSPTPSGARVFSPAPPATAPPR